MSWRPSIRVTLPATSANLGPGFDALGLAVSLKLRVEAVPADRDSIEATGRDAHACGRVQDHLILNSYRAALAHAGVACQPLALRIDNEIPLGMGCGSSAAARLAGLALARYFGGLAWTDAEVVSLATGLEGHPDNVAACWYGGFVASVETAAGVVAAVLACDHTWQLMLALPRKGVATERARGLLPDSYTRGDAVYNLGRTSLLTMAFAQQRLDLLRIAMQDRLHQPYRTGVCPLLRHLEELQAGPEFAGVALSGAGPALLTVLDARETLHGAEQRLHAVLGSDVELLPVRIAGPSWVETMDDPA